mmetsp:Transcript_13226/g.45237  ORF Transcript_13226/g.45237 Transcript_13226/m.45237 type:complete len:125 (+) Transcript_13226:253-627(+)
MHIRARTWSSVAERAAQRVLRAPVLTTMRNPRRCAGDRGRYSSAWAQSGTSRRLLSRFCLFRRSLDVVDREPRKAERVWPVEEFDVGSKKCRNANIIPFVHSDNRNEFVDTGNIFDFWDVEIET